MAENIPHFDTAFIEDHFRATVSREREALMGNEDIMKTTTVLTAVILRGMAGDDSTAKTHFDERGPTLSALLAQAHFSDAYMHHDDYTERGKARSSAVQKALREVSAVASLDIGVDPKGAKMAMLNEQTCSSAERYFAETVLQVQSGLYVSQSRVSVIHAEGQPLLIHKRHEAPSALTLVPFVVDGTPVPAGTIVATAPYQVNESLENKPREKVFEDANGQKAVYSAPQVLPGRLPVLRPLRLSPWAYPNAADRALFGVTETEADCTKPEVIAMMVDEDRANLVAGLNLADFRAAASRVLEICGANKG